MLGAVEGEEPAEFVLDFSEKREVENIIVNWGVDVGRRIAVFSASALGEGEEV